MKRGLSLLLLLVASASVARAQASMVPVTHPIYDWLLEQRVEGRLPRYQHEVRPMSRATIAAHLKTLVAGQDAMTRGERQLLDEFRNEFEMDRLIDKRGWTKEFVRGLPGSIPGAIRDRLDPVLVAWMSEDSVVSGAIYGAVGGGSLSLTEPGRSISGYYAQHALRMFLNTSYGFGGYVDFEDIWTRTERDLVAQLPRYNTEDLKPFSTSSQGYDVFFSYRAPRWFESYFGWGGQALGAALTDPLILRPEGPTFGSMRLQFGGPKLNLVYVHGALFAPSSDDTTGTPSMPIVTRSAPQRHFVAHRFTWMPSERLSVSAHEQTIYANRGPDLTYLNPLAPMYLVQLRTGDRDNLLIGGDAVYRPWKGTELRGSVILDDRSAPNPDAASFGPFKKAILFAVEQRVLPGVRLGVGYTEVDPWSYTHWQRINTYESDGKPLGPLMGPNAEEWAGRVTAWLPFRTRVMAGYRRIKKGLDPVGADTAVALCRGGNLFCGTVQKETPLYQGADIHVIGRVEVEGATEPIKGIPLSFSVRDDKVLKGTRLSSSRFVQLRFSLGF
jgi:hypothetical protein